MEPDLSDAALRFLDGVLATRYAATADEEPDLVAYALGLVEEDQQILVMQWAVRTAENRRRLVEVCRSVRSPGEADESLASRLRLLAGLYLASLNAEPLGGRWIRTTIAGISRAWAEASIQPGVSFARGSQPGSLIVTGTDQGLKVEIRQTADSSESLCLADPVGGKLRISDLKFVDGFAHVAIPGGSEASSQIFTVTPQVPDQWEMPVEGTESHLTLHRMRLSHGGIAFEALCESTLDKAVQVFLRIGTIDVAIGVLEPGMVGSKPTPIYFDLGAEGLVGEFALPGLLKFKALS